MNLIKTVLYTWLASKAVPGGGDPNKPRSRKGCCGVIAFVVGLIVLLIVAWALTTN